MTVALIAGGVVLVLLVSIIVGWRRSLVEEHSLRNYQHALATLREVTVRAGETQRSGVTAQSGVKGAVTTGIVGAETEERAVGEGSMSTRRERRRLVFSDEEADGPAEQFRLPIAPVRREHRGWRGVSIAGVVVTVGLAGAAVLALTTSRPPSKPRHTAHTATTTRHRPVVRARTGPTTTTTPVLPATLAPGASSTAGSATYTVGPATYTVSLAASTTPCWVYVKQVSSGNQLWTGTLEPSSTQTVHATGAVEVELGDSTGMSVTVDGHPVRFPNPADATLYLTFTPSPTS